MIVAMEMHTEHEMVSDEAQERELEARADVFTREGRYG